MELALRHAFPAREVAEIVGASVLPIQEHEVVKAILEERVSERNVEQIAWSVLVDHIKERIAVQSADVPVSQMMSASKAESAIIWCMSKCLWSWRKS